MQKPVFLCFLLLLLGWNCGCGTTQEHRIRQYPRMFEAMPPQTQQQIRQGRVEPGFSPLQVYLALGPPNGSSHYAPPPVQPGDQWTYLGRPKQTGFQTSYDWAILPNQGLHRLVIVFSESGVAETRLVPLGDPASENI